MYPDTQEQIGLWLLTLQMALGPQTPGQGSIQALFTQAFSDGQSEFKTHSGLSSGVTGGC